MDDAELLRQALEALKAPAADSRDLQHRIATRLAEIYGGGGTPSAGSGPEPILPILPGR